jgi:hypothetical protein
VIGLEEARLFARMDWGEVFVAVDEAAVLARGTDEAVVLGQAVVVVLKAVVEMVRHKGYVQEVMHTCSVGVAMEMDSAEAGRQGRSRNLMGLELAGLEVVASPLAVTILLCLTWAARCQMKVRSGVQRLCFLPRMWEEPFWESSLRQQTRPSRGETRLAERWGTRHCGRIGCIRSVRKAGLAEAIRCVQRRWVMAARWCLAPIRRTTGMGFGAAAGRFLGPLGRAGLDQAACCPVAVSLARDL